MVASRDAADDFGNRFHAGAIAQIVFAAVLGLFFDHGLSKSG